MLVTDDTLLGGRDLVALIRAAEQGGITSVQLRMKHVTAAELARLGRAVLQAVRIPVLVNDRVDVALAIGAHGVHLGPDDVPVAMARRIAPPGFVIGASVGLETELENGALADYWGVGPWAAYRHQARCRQCARRRGFCPPQGLRRRAALCRDRRHPAR